MKDKSEEAGGVLLNSACIASGPEQNHSSLPYYVLILGTWPASKLSKPRASNTVCLGKTAAIDLRDLPVPATETFFED